MEGAGGVVLLSMMAVTSLRRLLIITLVYDGKYAPDNIQVQYRGRPRTVVDRQARSAHPTGGLRYFQNLLDFLYRHRVDRRSERQMLLLLVDFLTL